MEFFFNHSLIPRNEHPLLGFGTQLHSVGAFAENLSCGVPDAEVGTLPAILFLRRTLIIRLFLREGGGDPSPITRF